MVRRKLVERGVFPLQTQRRETVKRELRKNLHTAGSFLERRALGMSTYELKNHIPILLKLYLSLCLPGEVVLFIQKFPQLRKVKVARVGSDPEF